MFCLWFYLSVLPFAFIFTENVFLGVLCVCFYLKTIFLFLPSSLCAFVQDGRRNRYSISVHLRHKCVQSFISSRFKCGLFFTVNHWIAKILSWEKINIQLLNKLNMLFSLEFLHFGVKKKKRIWNKNPLKIATTDEWWNIVQLHSIWRESYALRSKFIALTYVW